ncbi:phage virion morphogenesis protein [Pseudodesulfovibrio indicus]|uniref:Phage virion morphogenesis protein n=1 Tax=Pseudodesulfovibrio indicus TaxID=1716143 RepID=A0AA94TI23_9BACT|nr:phage virion morphogenesis protein [Pseudodesulfovibrio indicus]TDT86401.1 phage virion morphogenesis protein [Pseudodesulfovibrio indicus]
MSVTLQVSMGELERLASRIGALGNLDTRPLMDEAGALLESQTRRRIDEEKTAPDGTPWEPWSESYAASRHHGQSLLNASGALLDSIAYAVGIGGDHVEWGSNLVYAAAHNFGLDMSLVGSRRRITIPAREYLGLSVENEEDLAALVDDFIDRQMEALQ